MTPPTWTPDPSKTQVAADGRRRLWAFRDVARPAATQPVYDLDAADDEPVPQRRRRVVYVDDPPASGGWSAWAGRYAPTAGAGLAFTLILYFGGWWLGWFNISWGPTTWPQTQPSRNSASDGSRSYSRSGGGANRCREFLMQLRERGGFGSLSADEEAAAKQAIDEDGR